MAHAAASIKKARMEMEQAHDLKVLEKAREKRRRSHERAERRCKVMQASAFSISPYLHQSIRDMGPQITSSTLSSNHPSTIHQHSSLA